MMKISIGEEEFTYERVAKTRSETVYEVVLVVESRTGELSMRQFELDIEAREDLSSETVEEALTEWQADHDNLTIHRAVVEETDRCAFATRVADPVTTDDVPADAADESTASGPSPSRGETKPLFRGGAASSGSDVDFEDVDVARGDEVTFHVAGPDTSVYGTETGTVTGVKVGTDDHQVLIVETDQGTRRVREDWVVEE